MSDPLENVSEPAKVAIDIASAGTALGALVGALPEIAAIFTIVWTSIRIYETQTVQKMLGKFSAKTDQVD